MRKHILFLVFMFSILLAIACDSSRRTYIQAPHGYLCDSLVVNHHCHPPGHCKDKSGPKIDSVSEENWTSAASISYGSCGSCGTGDQVSQ